MSKLDDAIQKALERNMPPGNLVYTVITKNQDPTMSHINNTPVMICVPGCCPSNIHVNDNNDQCHKYKG